VAEVKFSTDLDPELVRRLKVYCVTTGQTIKSVVAKVISEKVPPPPFPPRQTEVTA
jgi:hypothetical protein